MTDIFSRSDVWIGLVVAIVGAIIAPPVWRVFRGFLLFIPSQIVGGFKDMWGHLGKLNRAKADPIAATAYVGYQCSQLVINAVLIFASYEAVKVLQQSDSTWKWGPHGWILGVLLALLAVFIFRVAKRAFQIYVLYEIVMNPIDPTKPIKIGNTEIAPFKPPDSDSTEDDGHKRGSK